MNNQTVYAHYTAHARTGLLPFLDEELARWTWQRLGEAFPLATSASLMPDHPHIVAPDEGEAGRLKLGRILGASGRALGRPFGRGALWEAVPPPLTLDTPDKHRRMDRYTLLNMCRPWRFRGRWVCLADDPLAWRWTTLHDVIGATADTWVPAARMAEVHGWRVVEAAEQIHRYVTRDDHVSRQAYELPQAPASSPLPDRSLDAIVTAALVSTRAPVEALRRRGPAREVFLGLARRQGWRQRAELAKICDVDPSTVSRIARRADPELIERAALCLHPRLQRSVVPVDLEALRRESWVVPPSLHAEQRAAPTLPGVSSLWGV